MDKELEDKLFEKYPKIFPNGRKVNPKNSLICFGLECGRGWYTLIDKLCKQLQFDIDRNDYPQVEAVQIKEKFGCYDKETEILTKEGWKYFEDLDYSDKIATLSENKELIYEEPSNIISYHYEGKMYKLKTRGVDMLVTPNHNLYLAKGNFYGGSYKNNKKEFPYEFTTPFKYLGDNKKFLKGCKWKGKKEETFILPSWKGNKESFRDSLGREMKRQKIKESRKLDIEDFLDFLGWYISEGCANDKGEISIAFNPNSPEEQNLIKIAINSTGNEERKYDGQFKFYDIQLALWLKENCGNEAINKKIPSFIKELNPEQIRIFLNSLFLGDGHKADTSYILTTISSQLADDIQELILKVGDTSNLRIRPPRSGGKIKDREIKANYKNFRINWMTNSFEHQTQLKGLAENSEEKWINYDDIVYDVTVPNHIICVRRNGIHHWNGNSLRFYIKSGNKEQFAMIHLAEALSLSICEYCGEFSNKVETKPINGWYKTLCPKCRKELEEE